MSADEIQEALPLAPHDLLVLSVLADGPMHGYGLIKAVEARSEAGVHLDPANLYRLLRRMRTNEWIEDVEAQVDGRRTHAITDLGQRVLAAEVARLEHLLVLTRPALARGGQG